MLLETNIPILSVLIVTYESANEIVACLESIPSELSLGKVEILVVDNDSRDGTPELVEKQFPYISLIRAGGNLGFSRGNNLAYAKCTGQTILYLNPDTVVNAEALESCLKRLLDEPNIGIISPKLVQADGTLDLACRRSIPSIWDGFTRATGLARLFPQSKFFAGYNLTYLSDDDTYPVGCVNGAFMMIRRDILDKIGLLDEQFFMYGEDLDLCYRCQQAALLVVYDGRYKIIHLKGQSSAKNYRMASKQIFFATEQFYLKNFNPHGSLLVKMKYHSFFLLWRMLSKIIAVLVGHKKARPL